MRCKITNKQLNPLMSFGKMPIANGFIDKENISKEFFFNMEVGFNEDIFLFQLNDHPKPEKKPMRKASFQLLHLIKKNVEKDRKKINGKRFIGGNENEANKPDINKKLYLNKLEFIKS